MIRDQQAISARFYNVTGVVHIDKTPTDYLFNLRCQTFGLMAKIKKSSFF